MKTMCRFYQSRPLTWTNKTTGEIKSGWLQDFDLDQGNGMRQFQGEVMRMNQGEVVAPGDYEVDFFLEKSGNGRINVSFLNYRPIKVDNKPQAIAS